MNQRVSRPLKPPPFCTARDVEAYCSRCRPPARASDAAPVEKLTPGGSDPIDGTGNTSDRITTGSAVDVHVLATVGAGLALAAASFPIV
jgi:hypothetical protein